MSIYHTHRRIEADTGNICPTTHSSRRLLRHIVVVSGLLLEVSIVGLLGLWPLLRVVQISSPVFGNCGRLWRPELLLWILRWLLLHDTARYLPVVEMALLVLVEEGATCGGNLGRGVLL